MAYDPVLSLSVNSWSGPFTAEDQSAATGALESGRVLFMPALPFLIEDGEADFLVPAALNNMRKNISLDPATGKVQGTSFEGPQLDRLAGMLDRFAAQTETLVRGLCPHYAAALERARTSFRPAEIAGRAPDSPRKDDKRLHVDAFPTRPTHGRRILRVFSNIAPDGTAREWRVGEPFPDLAAKFFAKLDKGFPGQAKAMAMLGLTKGHRSAYDFMMLNLHDRMKLDDAYQQSAPAAAVSFPPGTSWACFTDATSHAAMAGRFALEQTFHLPVAAMAEPAHAPVRVLEALAGRSLVAG